MKVEVTLPDWVWGRLATIASHRGVQVADLVAAGVTDVLRSDTGRLEQLQTELDHVRAAGYRAPHKGRSLA